MLMLGEQSQPTLVGENLVLFAGNSNPRLSQAIADYLEIPLGAALVGNFTNGETSAVAGDELHDQDHHRRHSLLRVRPSGKEDGRP